MSRLSTITRITFYASLAVPALVACCTLSLADSFDSEMGASIFVFGSLALALICPLYSAVYCACRVRGGTGAKIGFGLLFAVVFYVVQWTIFYAGCSMSGGYL